MHLIETLAIGGAQSMLAELYISISECHSQYKQIILSLENRPADKKFVSSYNISYSKVARNKILAFVLSQKKPIVIYHKLASSRKEIITPILKKKKIPVIVVNHTLYKSSDWANLGGYRMVAVSHHMKRKIKSWYPKIKCSVIRNFVNSTRYGSVKAKKVDKKGLFLTGRINRICRWKHRNDWIKWCGKIKLPTKMKHEYVGGGPQYGSAVNFAKQQAGKARNTVKLLGPISNFEEKISILKSWDLFLYETIRDEGISMAILESLASGIPVICSNHYGNKEIIENGINGFVYKDKAHAEKILYRLSSHPEELKELKKTTKEHFIKNLDAKICASKYIDLIKSVTKKPKIVIQEPARSPVIIEKPKEKKISQKFTILTSGYNKGKYLRDWADSILEQKYRPLEVVFANDQSTDNTNNFLQTIEKEFSSANIEFKVLSNKERLHCGASYRNLVGYATGSFFGVLDADDMLVDDAVEYIMGLYNKYDNIAWIYTQYVCCDMNMKKKRKGFCRLPEKGGCLLTTEDKRIHCFGHWRTFSHKIKRPDKLFGKTLKCSVDKYMGFRLEEFGPGMFANRVCYKYRQHPVGSPNSVSSTKYAIKVWKEVIKEAYQRRKKYKWKPFEIIENR